MCLCLLFLTAANFFVYPPSSLSVINAPLAHNNDKSDKEAPTPVEEKSSSKTGLTIQEEYIHDLHTIKGLSELVIAKRHSILPVENLQIVHFELVSPPPKA